MYAELEAELDVLSAAMREGEWSVLSSGRLSREGISRHKVDKNCPAKWT
jgi:hypothetical protein